MPDAIPVDTSTRKCRQLIIVAPALLPTRNMGLGYSYAYAPFSAYRDEAPCTVGSDQQEPEISDNCMIEPNQSRHLEPCSECKLDLLIRFCST